MNNLTLIKNIHQTIDCGDMETSPIFLHENRVDEKVSFNASMKDENGILKVFSISVESTVPPSEPKLYLKKAKLYKDFFNGNDEL